MGRSKTRTLDITCLNPTFSPQCPYSSSSYPHHSQPYPSTLRSQPHTPSRSAASGKRTGSSTLPIRLPFVACISGCSKSSQTCLERSSPTRVSLPSLSHDAVGPSSFMEHYSTWYNWGGFVGPYRRAEMSVDEEKDGRSDLLLSCEGMPRHHRHANSFRVRSATSPIIPSSVTSQN
jgi:hypothetical protein